MHWLSPRGLTSLFAAIILAAWCGGATAAPRYRSPEALAVSPDGKTVYASDPTGQCVVVLDAVAGKPVGEIPLSGELRGLALAADGKTLYVARRKAHFVAAIDTAGRAVRRQISVGPWPVAVVLAEKHNRLYTCNRGDHSVSVVELSSGKELKRIRVVREPSFAAMVPDGSRVVVANLLPDGPGTDPALAAEVSLVDTASMQAARIKLPVGSTVVTGAATSPDGRWAYVVHAIGRFHLPITQLERGWVHTYALSILDLAAPKVHATVLLDDLTGGSADPWAVVVAPDGRRLWVSHAGTHEVSAVEIAKVHELLEGKIPPELASLKDGVRDNIWVRIKQDKKLVPLLANDLTALYLAGAIRRSPTGGKGPRGLALGPDGGKLYAANYFSGTVGVIDTDSGKLAGTIPLGPQPAADAARRGEIYFHDATRCFQSWHSCASCHPDGRVDGLPWDFMRDDIGNPKDVISLVGIGETSPHNRRATRADPRECMRTGVIGSHLIVPEPADVEDLLAYVTSLVPEPNPLAGQFAEAARRGKRLFEGKANCAVCHPAPWYTDQLMHNVGVLTPREPDGKYDTPSLVEAYRTAPYFHDGRAATLRDVLTTHDTGGKHGNAKDLTPQELDDLIAFLLSL
jgi:YVTN family beta-propeller protein